MGVSPPPDTPETLAAAGVQVRVYARTDVGQTREHNEDAFLVADLRAAEPYEFADDGEQPAAGVLDVRPGAEGMLFMVADGLGGAAAGEVASHMAVHTVFGALRSRLPAAAEDPSLFAAALRDATLTANEAIHLHAQRHRELHGMGTTITAAALLGDTLFVSQVGDSRAYVVRDGAAQQITKDQSLMQKLVEAGEITPEQAETSARRNIILQALGPETSVKIDLTHQPVRRGDILVLCSDGLSGQVRAEEIGQLAATSADLDALCKQLIDLANERGGPDNITVVAARFDGDALGQPSSADAIGHRAFPLSSASDDGIATDDTVRIRRPALEDLPPLRSAMPTPSPTAAVEPAPDAVSLRDARQARARLYFIALAVAAAILAVIAIWRWFAGAAPKG